jgi:hypothetical protein
VLYNVACVAALAGERGEALMWLERAAEAGFDEPEHMSVDTDLATFRNAPAYARDGMLARMKKDQEARFALFANGRQPTPEKLEHLKQVDTDNRAWLKGVLAEHGWPMRTRVGERAPRAAWLMVQHAGLDRAFQKECLALMEKAVAADEVNGKDLAYLTDRVLVGEGKPQRYGTQFTEKDAVMVPQPMEDPERVDARRASVGLDSMAAYTRA